MARHRQETPTNVELEILQVLWDRGPSTVREVVEELGKSRPRAYTSILSMLNVMLEKDLVVREERDRAHVYEAKVPRQNTLGDIVRDVLGRAFEGSASSLITHVLDQSQPSDEELAEIQKLIDRHLHQRRDE